MRIGFRNNSILSIYMNKKKREGIFFVNFCSHTPVDTPSSALSICGSENYSEEDDTNASHQSNSIINGIPSARNHANRKDSKESNIRKRYLQSIVYIQAHVRGFIQRRRYRSEGVKREF